MIYIYQSVPHINFQNNPCSFVSTHCVWGIWDCKPRGPIYSNNLGNISVNPQDGGTVTAMGHKVKNQNLSKFPNHSYRVFNNEGPELFAYISG